MKCLLYIWFLSGTMNPNIQQMLTDSGAQVLNARVVEEVVRVDPAITTTRTERRARLLYKNDPTLAPAFASKATRMERIPDSLRILKPNPKAQAEPTDAFMREKQDWMDRISLQLTELDQEIQMVQNNTPRSGRLKQLKNLHLKTQTSHEIMDKANTAEQLQKAIRNVKPILAQTQRYLSAG
ncbi:hypothetical protein BWI93_02860 [Siphonobacter sp. BAB-5385]|uniref:hypothetical protein n=1 Tax=Siphonobacter sp. BAB-5385 TaxID=1864822 RepID=UPI000B9DFB7B|nr:hypothetical protein [Siphonobacter sp. BAB-5385]OZI09633.1 hypothetical protein BWI93_02860 [Siphonobacter sp. BAB-5385]